MILTIRKNTYLFILLVISSRIVSFGQEPKSVHYLKTGADQIGSYLPILKGKRIAMRESKKHIEYHCLKSTAETEIYMGAKKIVRIISLSK